ncbi:MAG: FtsX-like permease family protein, partial [Propionicimonas sp.]|nr:FtsX-like permease family protein [Propionicimonas sp.]
DSDVHRIARLAFDNTRMLPAYTAEYDNRVATHATALERLLAPQPEQRLRTLRADKQADIDQGWQKITDAEQRIADGQAQLDDAKQELADARATLREKRREFASSLRNGRERISTAERQLADLRSTIDSAQADLKAAKRQLDAATTTLQLKRKELDAAADQLAQTAAQLDGLKQELDQAEQQISAAEAAIAQRQAVCEALGEDDSGYQQCAAQVAAALAELDVHRAEYQKGAATYQAGVTQWEAGQQAYRRGLKDHAEGTRKLEKGTAEYHKNAARLDQAKRLLNSSTDTLNKARKELATQQAEGEQKIAEAEAEIRDGERSYAEKLAEFEHEKADAEAEIADHRADLQQAQEILDGLELPVYTVADRNANPGYQTFGEYSERIGVLAGVFPVFMFAIAALVSLTSMTRMVDEQRIVMGTFAALGYGRRDIKRKFLLYGFAASTAGAVIGATLGHLLLPPIIYRAYAANFSLDGLALGFHPGVTVLSYAIALACTVGSASLVARGALREVPAHLLAPKPPAKGTRILLERITVLWNRLGFIQKVTARNLFRYKKRMLMTIVGIAGSSALLITGFGLRDSIGGIASQQFGRLMTYDLVAVESDKATAEESTQIARTIADSDQIADHMAVRYENLTFTGGRNNTQQNVTLMVPGEGASFQGFVQLAERTTGNPLALGSEGVVISEKTASLLNVRPGDRVTLDDSDGVARTLPVAGVAEWYVGHYLFASPQVYAEAFGHPPRSNATLVELQDGASLDRVCADLLALDGMQAILLSESVSRTIESIMGGLNYVILVLITVAIMLAVVITFNLTSINISERIRELSTIKVLGFYPLEVTLYIYRETLLLTVLGILGGYGLGAWLHSFINATLPPDSTMFEPALLASNFAATAAITLAISALI